MLSKDEALKCADTVIDAERAKRRKRASIHNPSGRSAASRACPYCHQQALSRRVKLSLGPVSSVRCQACGKRISVSWWAMLGVLPLELGIFVAYWIRPWRCAIGPVMVGLTLMLSYRDQYTPLVRRDEVE
jgi:hypothetical protein